MRATALIYSGRPNPSWEIGGARAVAIDRAIAAMAPAPHPPGAAAGLGYAGVRLEVPDGDGRLRSWVFSAGIACTDGRSFVDADRHIERDLLEAGAELGADPCLANLI